MKILVVEDNPKLLKLLAHLLEKEGYDVACATGGKEGIALYEERNPAIICLDVVMEDASGFDICRQIRSRDARVIIILITSKSRNVDIEEGQKAGANDYIVKPFDLADITARIRDVARSCISRDNPELFGQSFALGEVRVFPGQLRAERPDKAVDLSMRDVGLLKLFYDQRGKIIPVTALKPYCWMQHSPDEAKAIEWHVVNLRRKIEADPERPALIKAAAGGGYIHE